MEHKYYAHSCKGEDKHQWQLLRDHLLHTASLASKLAGSFGAERLAYIAGLAHDIGKYSREFQARLEGRNIQVDHSTPGAFEIERLYGPVGKLLAYVVAGHHCGLPDWGSLVDEASLEARLSKQLTDYSAFGEEIHLPPPGEVSLPALKPVVDASFSAQFLIRFVYSCLVDADFLDTEKALSPEKAAGRVNDYSLKELAEKLDRYIDELCASAPDTPINQKRAEIVNTCRIKSRQAPGLFTLTVPTGGGKTLSSLSFALQHALTHGKERVIYVIPYTSIIEQNAAVFREILGTENVLEHHSNFSYPHDEQSETEAEYAGGIGEKLKLAAENWDLPVIATTNVQFFESLFAARSSKCRKLHNIANSVVIIDEAQMIPTGFLKPCLNAVAELVVNYGTTVVLCTATQPAIGRFLPEGIKPVEIVDDTSELFEVFKRVQVYNAGSVSDDRLAEKLAGQDQVLCIVNSKKHARLLFERIRGEGVFHLSTRMCPVHRTAILDTIKERLKAGKTCRVVSTQLIEAGVDVDFPVVYRSMAGLDSIAQSAGRCNREGRLPLGQVYVFWPEKHGLPRGWLSRTASLGSMVLERYADALGPEAVEGYFTSLFELDAAELDRKGILADIREQAQLLRFPLRTIADKFKLIDDNTSTIIIPWDDTCRNILEEAGYSPFPAAYIRRLQRYAVNVYEEEFKELLEYGALEVVAGRFYVLKDEVFNRYYDQGKGLEPFTKSMFLNDTLII